jgi:hypothetical protein
MRARGHAYLPLDALSGERDNAGIVVTYSKVIPLLGDSPSNHLLMTASLPSKTGEGVTPL